MGDRHSFTVKTTQDGLTDLIGRVNALLEAGECPDRTTDVVNLVLEEILTNIVKYGFDDEGVHDVEVRLLAGSKEISIEFVDCGREFDPLSVPFPPSRESFLGIDPGGRGILLVREIVDSIKYRR